MRESPSILETVEVRLVLVDPRSRMLWMFDTVAGYRLPRLRIPRLLRPAQRLQKEIHAALGVHVVLLDLIVDDTSSAPYAIAELLTPIASSDFKAIKASQLPPPELSEREYSHLVALLNGETKGPFSHIGWIDCAVHWVESETGRRVTSRNEIEQYNAGGSFALVRFPMTSGWNYWLKATGEPNRHEPTVTKILSQLGAGYVPEVLAVRPEWNAVLLSGQFKGFEEISESPNQIFEVLGDAVETMADLQMRTEGHRVDLLNAGAFDQGMDVLFRRTPELFDYLEEVLSLHLEGETRRLDGKRIKAIRTAVEEICQRSRHLRIPETIVHGDMNPGNIVIGCGHCQFIDWSEAYVGNCLVTLQHLLLLNRVESPDVKLLMNAFLKQRYLDVWLTAYDSASFEEGCLYMPLLGAVSALYGRGDWLTLPERNSPRRQSHARMLALYMDNALQAPELQEAVCR